MQAMQAMQTMQAMQAIQADHGNIQQRNKQRPVQL
jgi:hypothetical protein